MATFKDTAGREWMVAIDAPSIMRIRETCDPQFMLNDANENNTYSRMQEDPVVLCRVLFELCLKQRQERDISEEAFYLGIIGDVIDDATAALLKAILSFSPRRTRELLEAFADKETRIQHLLSQTALDKIKDPQIEERMLTAAKARIDAAIEGYLTPLKSATSLPGS